MFFGKQTGIVAPPVASGPSGALIQELDIVFQGGLNLTFPVVLNPGCPFIRYQPPRNKIVIISVELKGTPTLSLEPVQK